MWPLLRFLYPPKTKREYFMVGSHVLISTCIGSQLHPHSSFLFSSAIGKRREKKKKPPFETLNFAFVAIQTKNWKIDLSGNTIEIVV
jgi:hypothetical protein